MVSYSHSSGRISVMLIGLRYPRRIHKRASARTFSSAVSTGQTAVSHIPSSSLGPSSGHRRQADMHLEETLKTFWTCNTQINLAPHYPLSNSNLPSSKTSMPVGKQVPTQLLRRQKTGSFAQSLILHATNPTNTFCKDPTTELVPKKTTKGRRKMKQINIRASKEQNFHSSGASASGEAKGKINRLRSGRDEKGHFCTRRLI